jgi:asparagine synthase (glutamine-hydrolysing)
MCGVFAIIQPNPIPYQQIGKMGQMLRHRGPDDEGFVFFPMTGNPPTVFFSDETCLDQQEGASTDPIGGVSLPLEGSTPSGGIVFGHRRLSIIDLSASGHQPMSSQNGKYWITYNGEIYNHIELRDELSALGFVFNTKTDTEVIINAYEAWGEKCLNRFNGMWSFIIYNVEDQSVFASRDRFGIKPLYYFSLNNGGIAFASEIKAFTVLNDWRARSNTSRCLDFLVWNIMDHTEDTMFDGVYQVPPGHFIKFSSKSLSKTKLRQSWKAEKWYDCSMLEPGLKDIDHDSFSSLFASAVELHLRSDAPVGSCLSGGLDSSSLVCVATELILAGDGVNRLSTFTARSNDARFDESAYAEAVISETCSLAKFVTPTAEDLFAQLDRLIWHQDEPFVSTSIYAQWSVFNLASRSGIKVVLDGQGADELLAGYQGYVGAYLASLLHSLKLTQFLREIRALKNIRNIGFLKSLAYAMVYLFPAANRLVGKFDNRAYSDLSWISPKAQARSMRDPFRDAGGRPRSVKKMSISQLTKTNLPMLLHWEDRNSMAHSVEARVPFLDYRLVRYCLDLPAKEKLSGGWSKKILRDAMRGIVPDAIVDRTDKMGFVTAEEAWMKEDVKGRFRNELVEAVQLLPNLFSSRIIDQFDEMVCGARSFDFRFWRVIVFARWVRQFDVEFDI